MTFVKIAFGFVFARGQFIQIGAEAKDSVFVKVPEPGTLALLAAIAVALGMPKGIRTLGAAKRPRLLSPS